MIGNINIINKKVSRSLLIEEQTIKKINEVYFKYLKNKLSNGTSANYFVKELGTFSSDLNNLRREIHLKLDNMRYLKRLDQNHPEVIFSTEKAKADFRNLWKQYDDFRIESIKQYKQFLANHPTFIPKKNRTNNKGVLTTGNQQERETIQPKI